MEAAASKIVLNCYEASEFKFIIIIIRSVAPP